MLTLLEYASGLPINVTPSDVTLAAMVDLAPADRAEGMEGCYLVLASLPGLTRRVRGPADVVRALVAAASSGGGVVGPEATIYVDHAAPTGYGDDATAARGDASKPFATLAAALAVFTTGDRLVLAPGTYNVPLGLTLPVGVTAGSMWSSGATLLGANGIDLLTLTGALDSFTIDGVTLTAKAGGRPIVVDGTASGGNLLTTGLTLRNLQIGGGSSLYAFAGVVTWFNVVDSDAGNTWTLNTCAVPTMRMVTIGGNLAATFDDDHAAKPAVIVAPLVMQSSTVGLVLSIGGQQSIDADRASRANALRGATLTESVSGIASTIVFHGAYAGLDFSTGARALPDTTISMFIDFSHSFAELGATHLIAVGGAAVNPQSARYAGATLYTAQIGANVEALMSLASMIAPETNLTVVGTGTVYPPPFTIGPIAIVASPQSIPLPWPLIVGTAGYHVSPELNDATAGAYAIPVKTDTDFDVTVPFIPGGLTLVARVSMR